MLLRRLTLCVRRTWHLSRLSEALGAEHTHRAAVSEEDVTSKHCSKTDQASSSTEACPKPLSAEAMTAHKVEPKADSKPAAAASVGDGSKKSKKKRKKAQVRVLLALIGPMAIPV